MLIENLASVFASHPVLAMRDRVPVSRGSVEAIDSKGKSKSDAYSFSSEARLLSKKVSGEELTESELKQVEELEKRDREVKRHEQAHASAAGQYAQGGPRYEYQTGPDGKRYAVGGHVNIDTSPIKGDPQATLEKADVIRKAALAPSEPSPQDRKVAQAANKMEAEARREISEERTQEATFNSHNPSEGDVFPANFSTNRESLYQQASGQSLGTLWDQII